MTLPDVWASWQQPTSPPFVLDCDLAAVQSTGNQKTVATHRCWREARDDPEFCAPDDNRLHLGLLPHPFCGNLRTATIYVLLLNPGLGSHDYYDECEIPGCKSALLGNLRQEFDGRMPFLFLDPQFAWHGGFVWWHGRLAGVIDRLAKARGSSFAEARRELASKLASVQLLPYHSLTSAGAGRWLNKLDSAKLARQFVSGCVLPRVVAGEAIVIVTRQVSAWGLPDLPGVVKYTGGWPRYASLTPASPGGKAILRHLGV